MKLSTFIAKLQAVEETSGDMDVLWRDGFFEQRTCSLVPIGDLALLYEEVPIGEEKDTNLRPIKSMKGEPVLIIKSATVVQAEAKAQAA